MEWKDTAVMIQSLAVSDDDNNTTNIFTDATDVDFNKGLQRK